MTNRGEFDGGLEEGLRNVYNGEYGVDYSNFFLGMVMDDADDLRMGRVWVYIPGLSARRSDEEGTKPLHGGTPPDRTTGIRERNLRFQQYRAGWIECYPLFPFFGSDDYRVQDGPAGRNGLDGDPQSYGMPLQPRNGDMVGVLFAFGDAARAFWIGCMPKALSNQMVPGVPGAEPSKISDTAGADLKSKVDPVNARIPALEKKHRPDAKDKEGTPKPVSPRYQNVYPASEFANNLLEAGLMNDKERGAGLSGFRRESPSYVIGFKSAGWTYSSEKKNVNSATGKLFDGTEIGARQVGSNPGGDPSRDYTKVETVGHQFVMDDHPEYQSVRLRSSAGSQILFNDSADRGNNPYIFINTPKGNVWIEMRDDGGINIFASDSISIHAEKDLNLKVDGNMNLEVDGNLHANVGGNMDWRVKGKTQMEFGNPEDPSNPGTVDMLMSDGSYDLKVSGIAALQAFGGFDITSGAHIRMGSSTDFTLNTADTLYIDALKNVESHSLLGTKITGELSVDIRSIGPMRASSDISLLLNGGLVLAADAAIVNLNSGGVPKASRAIPYILGIPTPAFQIDEITPAGGKPKPGSTAPVLKKVYPRPTQEQIYKADPPSKDLTALVPIIPQHLPWPDLVDDSSGFGGWVEPVIDPTTVARKGATRATAFRPMNVKGMIGGERGVWQGIPYQTQSPSEKPNYTKIREFEPGELTRACDYTTSDEMKAFIKQKEGLRVFSYSDAGKAWAIGYGHNIKVGDVINGVKVGKAEIQELDRTQGKSLGGQPLIISPEEADELFDKDLAKFEKGVCNGVTTEITQGQYDAMVSFSYNVGVGAFSKSTMLRKLNEGNVDEVPNQWMRWVNVNGQPNSGLRARRDEELRFFTA